MFWSRGTDTVTAIETLSVLSVFWNLFLSCARSLIVCKKKADLLSLVTSSSSSASLVFRNIDAQPDLLVGSACFLLIPA